MAEHCSVAVVKLGTSTSRNDKQECAVLKVRHVLAGQYIKSCYIQPALAGAAHPPVLHSIFSFGQSDAPAHDTVAAKG